MPSNKELISSIGSLAGELGLQVDTAGLSNKKLVETLADLRAKQIDAENDTNADAAEAEKLKAEAEAAEAEKLKAEAEAAEAEKHAPYCVAPGKAITSKRGILSDGAEVQAEHLEGGADALQSLVASGHVLER